MNELASKMQSEIATTGDFTKVSWTPPANMSYQEWESLGQALQTMSGSINWWIGDWLNEGERRYGEMYAQAIEVTGWDYKRLAQVKWVASSVEFSLRKENLSWSKHVEVAKLPPEKQQHWLSRAVNEDMSTRQLREAIRASEQPQALPADHQPADKPQDFTSGNLWGVQGDYESGEYQDEYKPLAFENDSQQPVKPHVHVAQNSGNNEWYTPVEFTDSAKIVMGCIDLDPASSEIANKSVKAGKYFTKDEDGLLKKWSGNVWMNPPYSQPEISLFSSKLVANYRAGDIKQAIVLVNNATETAWFHTMLEVSSAVCFVKSRIRFVSPDGESGAPLQGQAILYLGDNGEKFFDEFSQYGVVLWR